jgi:hypothetical protein
MNRSPPLSDDVKRCIDDCQACHAECLETAMHMCLEMGGQHTEPEHFRLMIGCSQLCATAADLMLSRSELHEQCCALCAEACDSCAASCERIGGMDHCVELCRRCAESCRAMSGTATSSPNSRQSRSSAGAGPALRT